MITAKQLPVEPHRDLRGDGVAEIAWAGIFVREAKLKLVLRVRREAVAARGVDPPKFVAPRATPEPRIAPTRSALCENPCRGRPRKAPRQVAAPAD